MEAKISPTVKTVPHENPQALVSMWAQIVVQELLRQEAEVIGEGGNV